MSVSETSPDAASPLERRNERTTDIDQLDTLGVLLLLNAEDQKVAGIVERAIDQLADLVELAYTTIAGGGRVHYFGAGTSGRLAVLDAVELQPTFEASDLVVAHIAGGPDALLRAMEGAEDNLEVGARDASEVTPLDLAIGITASGATPYVTGALAASVEKGAATAVITSNPDSPMLEGVDVQVVLDTGPEAVAGSTRLKAGTAQKMALNCFSTALMIRLGRTWSNLMVSMSPTNEKLRRRAISVLVAVTGDDETTASEVLEKCSGDLRVAVVHRLTGESPRVARDALARNNGSVRAAVDHLKNPAPPKGLA